jgi:FkbM family methyltransferase
MIHTGNAHTLGSMSTDWIEKVQKASFFPGCYWDREEVVQTTTLDALIDQFGVPDFCKIDVEGFEFEVLRGLSRPVGTISREYTSGVLEPRSIHPYLASWGMDHSTARANP